VKGMIIISNQEPVLPQNYKEYMQRNNFEMALFMEFSLPYYLLINSGFYEFMAHEGFVLSQYNKTRKIAFKLESYAHRNQEVPLRESTSSVHVINFNTQKYRYEVFNSTIGILIQSFNSEAEELTQLIRERGRDLSIEIMQSCLEYIIFKYNESTNGLHAIVPSVYDCGHLALYYIHSNCLLKTLNISPNMNTISQISDTSFKESLKNKIIVWKAFCNESKYAFRTYDFKRAIIYSAIALETFVSSLTHSYITDPEKYEQDDNGNYFSIFKRINLLIRDSFLVSSISNREIMKNVENITKPRNIMMHGHTDNLQNLKETARISIESLNSLLEDWEARNTF
jgi:hypothetical protein